MNPPPMNPLPMSPALSCGSEIRTAWEKYRADNPTARAREAALALGVSEGQLVASLCDGGGALRLRPDWPAFLTGLESLGRVMALTRNESCVIEKEGVYRSLTLIGPMMGHFTDPEIDLRLFLSHWTHLFAVETETPRGTQRSLQVFDAQGNAVHKTHLRPVSDLAAFEALRASLRDPDQSTDLVAKPAAASTAERPDASIDIDGFLAGWRAMKDTHEFFFLLRNFGVTRRQAMRLAAPEFVRTVAPDSVSTVLHGLSADERKCMVFVGNPGCLEIHGGPVKKVVVMGEWLNVMDPGFNLHLRADHVAECFVVRKPTETGDVTSLELYDAGGEQIALLFGYRKGGEEEERAWVERMETLG